MSMVDKPRPSFPKRAVVTGGMPYGGKLLHYGHVGGYFVHADVYARFLRDRLGDDNVIFVSGTDCYGSEPVVKFHDAKKDGFLGTLEDFVELNHISQKNTLAAYDISLNLYAASCLGVAGDIHKELSHEIFNSLYDNGYLKTEEILQFFDEETQTFLNGRQVKGRCPVVGCRSESAYADECELGHQFNPQDLIAPVAVTNGKTPSLRPIKNWYFDLEKFLNQLKLRQTKLREEGVSRRTLLSEIDNFLKDPAVFVRLTSEEEVDILREACSKMPAHTADINEENKSAVLLFAKLKDREDACKILRESGIRFRTGTTLVPFRLSGNSAWGIDVPEKDGISGQTFWVWPESLWAPISFVKAYLKQKTGSADGWTDWWFNPDASVYQFIGEDNVYFYAVAEMGLFMALNAIAGREETGNLPTIVPNKHVFFGSKKASSSGVIKPPNVDELLEYYTAEQLRMHFAHMALQHNSVSFNPKAVMGGEGFDVTLAEGNILTNVYNRIVRSCFYTVQKYYDGKLPAGDVSKETKIAADELVCEYEWAMYRVELSKIIDMIDVYLRDANKAWAAMTKEAEADNNESLRAQIIVDTFHVVRTAATLLHPFAPRGTKMVREYLGVDERLWDWTHIFEPLRFFMGDGHSFKFLEPRVDFFVKHEAQLK